MNAVDGAPHAATPVGAGCRRLPDGFSVPTGRGILTLRPVRVDNDLDLVHDWMNRPHVARYWQQDWPADRVRDCTRCEAKTMCKALRTRGSFP